MTCLENGCHKVRQTNPNRVLFLEQGLIEIATYAILLIGEKPAHNDDGVKSALKSGGMVNYAD